MKLLALVAGALLLAASPATAQDTICLYGDTGSGLSRSIETGDAPFDIAVITETDHTSTAAEFVLDDVKALYPSVMRLSITKINDTPLDYGDNGVGEYYMAYATCVNPGEVELVRISYGDFGLAIGQDVVLGVRGFGPGDSQPSSFGGEPGYLDCDETPHVLTGKPWDVAGQDPTRLPGVDSADGVVVLKAVAIPTSPNSISTLKSRY